MTDTIMLTGGTGHVGSALLPRLLDDPEARVLVLIRARNAEHLVQRRTKLLAKAGVADQAHRIEAIRGDVTAPDLGLSGADRDRIDTEVDSIIHSAASVRFDMPAESAVKQNIESTKAVVAVAKRLAEAGRLRRYDHISTCYVAGKRLGRVFEHECDVKRDFGRKPA